MEKISTTKNPIEYETPNSLAAVWSMMMPGLGQLMKGRVMPGIFWAFFVAAGYFSFFWPGLILHSFCILDAAFYKGSEKLVSLNSWPKRLGFLGTVSFLLVYIVIRNHF